MSLEVIYHDVPVDTGTVTASGDGHSFCSYAVTNRRNYELTPHPPQATLEPDSWLLDGSFGLLGDWDMPEFWGAALSDEAGMLPETKLVLKTEKPCSATGITLRFWEETNQWCSRIRLCWYGRGVLLAEQTAYPTGADFVLERPVTGFDEVVLYLEQTSRPFRFPRVSFFGLGRRLRFGHEALSQVQLLQECDPTLCTLPADTMTVSLRQERYTLLPQENQPMELYRDGRLLATQFITQCRRESGNRYVFSCQSRIGLLEQPFPGSQCVNGAVEFLLDEILGMGNAVELHQDLPCYLTGALPKGTAREALQQIAFALGARVTTRGGGLQLQPLEREVTGSFKEDKIFAGIKVDSDPKLARVELTAHSYGTGQLQLLVKELSLEGRETVLTFHEPYAEFYVEGGEILESGSATLRLTGDIVSVWGIPFIHSRKLYTREGETSGEVLAVEEATLVNDENAPAVLERLFRAASARQKVTFDAVLDDQYPGQWVTVPSPWGETMEGVITAINARLTPNGQTANITVRAL